jgi:hypothetical protein
MAVNGELLKEEAAAEEVLMPVVVAGGLSSEWVLRVEDVEGVLLLGVNSDGAAWRWSAMADTAAVVEERERVRDNVKKAKW